MATVPVRRALAILAVLCLACVVQVAFGGQAGAAAEHRSASSGLQSRDDGALSEGVGTSPIRGAGQQGSGCDLGLLLCTLDGWAFSGSSGDDAPSDVASGSRARPAVSGARSFISDSPATAVSEPAGYTYDDSRSLVVPSGLVDEVASTGLWSQSSFNGTRVYQRNDLIDPGLVDGVGRANLERMQSGLAPIGPDGKSLNLHHALQTNDSAIVEMTQTFHQTNSRVIHINPSSVPSGIDRSAFNTWRRDYWRSRACDFGGC